MTGAPRDRVSRLSVWLDLVRYILRSEDRTRRARTLLLVLLLGLIVLVLVAWVALGPVAAAVLPATVAATSAGRHLNVRHSKDRYDSNST